jgi:hypothetical protein
MSGVYDSVGGRQAKGHHCLEEREYSLPYKLAVKARKLQVEVVGQGALSQGRDFRVVEHFPPTFVHGFLPYIKFVTLEDPLWE